MYTYFLRSTLDPFDWTVCDDCESLIKDVDSARWYWNPKRRARIRNICCDCYDFRWAKVVHGWKQGVMKTRELIEAGELDREVGERRIANLEKLIQKDAAEKSLCAEKKAIELMQTLRADGMKMREIRKELKQRGVCI